MTPTMPNHSRPFTLEYATLIGIISIFALMLYAVAHYPASLSQGGLQSLLTTTGALLAYGGFAVWVRRRSSASLQIALQLGAKIGILLGSVAVINHTFEVFVSLGSPLSSILGVSMWGLMFLMFGVAGSATYHRVGSLHVAVLASIWSALTSTAMILFYGYLIGVLFLSRMQHILQGAFAQSGLTDPQAFVIKNTLESGTSHVILAPCIAAFFGFVGGCAGALLGSINRGLAIGLGVCIMGLAGSGVAALQFATSLNRSERPPYIMFGLLTLGFTMACAHPLLTAICHRATPE